MSTAPKTLHFNLKTLSPVVIGDGDQTGLILNTDYVISGDQFCYLDPVRVESLLTARPDLLDGWSKGLSRSEFHRFDLADFLREEAGVEAEDLAYQTLPLGDLSYQNRANIRTIVKTRGRPYLPGSTLKGSFKAALFWGWLMEDRRGQAALDKIIKELYDRAPIPKNRGVVGRVVRNAAEELFGKMVRDRRMDANRLRFGDSALFEDSALEIVAAERFHFFKSSKAIPTPTEAIAPGETSHFQLTHFLDERGFTNPYLRQFSEVRDYLSLFRRYSHAFINWEMEQLDAYPPLRDVYLFYEDLMQTPDRSILRIGQGKGWYLNSIGLALECVNPNAIHRLRKIFKVGKERGKFLRTRTVTLQDREPMDPLGWLELWGQD